MVDFNMSSIRKIFLTDASSINSANVATIGDTTNIVGQQGVVTVANLTGFVGSSKTVPVRVDASTHSLQVMEYEHHEIHSGSHFFVDDTADMSINDAFDIQFTTPNGTDEIHFGYTMQTSGETETWIYENVNIVTPLTVPVTAFNNNRNSIRNSNVVLNSFLHASVAAANGNTNVVVATLLRHSHLGVGRTGGSADRSKEIVLQNNTNYCLRAVAEAATIVDFDMNWYEHTPKD